MASDPVIFQAGEKKRLARRWIVLAAAVVLVAAIFLPPLINLNRYQHRIAASISDSLGRQVHMSSVSLRLFPLPALAFSGFVIEDEPQYGAEPMLQAESVTAYPRISSLWRGRLEIARIDFDHASLNLVRIPDGGWNFAPVLGKAAQVRQAPTGQRRPGAVLRFPYIEASHSRINFKIGLEKKPFSFLDSDLSVWLDNSGKWGVHFKARPARTDVEMDLEDTGTLRVDGRLRRAADLDEMPLDLHIGWSDAPLGQLSRLLLGHDSGWRGLFGLSGRIQGPAGHARIHMSLQIARLHRAEFMPDYPLDLQASCDAVYRKGEHAVEDISCTSPVGDGGMRLTGAVGNVDSRPRPNVVLKMENVPAGAILAALREVRGDVADGVRAEGKLEGKVLLQPGPKEQLTGKLRIDALVLRMPGNNRPYAFAPVELLCESGGTSAHANAPAKQAALLLQPVRLPMGGTSPLALDGRFTTSGFELHVSGGGSLARLHGLSTLVEWSGVSATRSSRAALGPKGTAKLDLDLQGPWIQPIAAPGQPLAPLTATGSIAIANGELIASYLPQPVKIASAEALLSPGEVAWTNVSMDYDGLQGKGTFEYPSLCDPASPCAARFHMTVKSIDLAKVQKALGGTSREGDLLRDLLSRIDSGRPRAWPTLEGSIAADAITAGPLTIQGATGALKVSGNALQVQSLNGKVLGGTMHMSGAMEFTGGQPKYQWTAQIEGASSAALAGLFHEHWGNGLVDLSGQWKMTGWTARQLTDSADGEFHWNWIRSADLSRARNSFLKFRSWTGNGVFENRVLKIVHSRLDREAQTIPIAGTISFDRELDLESTARSSLISVTGTLAHPVVKASLGSKESALRSGHTSLIQGQPRNRRP